MRVLLAESDADAARNTEALLHRAGYLCEVTDRGEEAVELARLYDFDILIQEVILKDVDGYEVLRRLRRAGIDTPVLVLSVLTALDEKVRALCAGADDYLTKPFDERELVARMRAIVRRARGHSDSVIRIGRMSINLDLRCVEVDGRPVRLTGKEYGILELLCLRKGVTLTKEMFLNHLYGGVDEPDAKAIDVFICKLRKKLDAASSGESFIETIWGRGYVLRDPGDEAPRKAAFAVLAPA